MFKLTSMNCLRILFRQINNSMLHVYFLFAHVAFSYALCIFWKLPLNIQVPIENKVSTILIVQIRNFFRIYIYWLYWRIFHISLWNQMWIILIPEISKPILNIFNDNTGLHPILPLPISRRKLVKMKTGTK